MRTFTNEKSYSIYRQSYSGSPAVSSYALASTGTCYLRPLTEESSSVNGIQYGYGFNLITEIGVDIREGDLVVINTVQYTVRGVVAHDRGYNTQYNRALISKSTTLVTLS